MMILWLLGKSSGIWQQLYNVVNSQHKRGTNSWALDRSYFSKVFSVLILILMFCYFLKVALQSLNKVVIVFKPLKGYNFVTGVVNIDYFSKVLWPLTFIIHCWNKFNICWGFIMVFFCKDKYFSCEQYSAVN